jgi:hypothetical protein
MLWSKQYCGPDVNQWLEENEADPMQSGAHPVRKSEWFHMVRHVNSMPDKREYPWHAG